MAYNHDSYSHTLTELFEQRVMETPEAVAIHHEGQQLTYNQLNKKATQIALILQKKGVEPTDFVALLLDSGIDFIACILGIVKAGGVYLPLDTLAPTHRLEEIIKDANPKLIISSKKYMDMYDLTHEAVYEINELVEEANSLISDHFFRLPEPTSPVYMMYTSGSTGCPKGVIVAHQAVVNLVFTDNFAKVGEREHVAQFSNLAFDGSTFEIWSALLNGATLVIIPPEIKTDHNKLQHFLKINLIKYLFLPTGFFHQLINSAPDTLDFVEVIIFGGEQVNTLLLKKLMTRRKKEKLPVTLINGYGPTEATTFTCRHVMDESGLDDEDELGSIGNAIDNVSIYILDKDKKEAQEGELYISGVNLAIQYHRCSVQNEEKFLPNPFSNELFHERMYKTGDKVRKLPSGKLLFLERVDDQVKIGGFRIHLSEIEKQLMQHPEISLAAVNVETGGGSHQILTAYIVLLSPDNIIHADEVRCYLSNTLPVYMLPAKYVLVSELPLTSVGKVNRRALDKLPHTDLSFHVDNLALSEIEEKIKTIWQHLLNRESIDVNKNLFELGVNSLLIMEACTRINEALQSELKVADMLSYPTIHKLSRYLDGNIETPKIKEIKTIKSHDIAIIGMSCRFPEANSIDEYWQNLCESKDCLTRFSGEELDKTHKNQYRDANYVPVRGTLTDVEQFDAHFFGFNPADASITDPQQRLFLECAWEALEHAAVAPEKQSEKIISVYAGMADSTYLHENLLKNNWFIREHDRFQSRISSSIGMLSTQVSYRLNLKGRSVNVNTACSTGLVVVDEACQALIADCCDIALAGAVSVLTPQNTGYLYQKGSIESPDGQCRPFSENANGTVFSNGVGVVILKRLADAIMDKDTIYAVIKGRGVNNDGSDKLGFTAPSTSGQMACIRSALAEAKLTPDDIGYVEAHGTATALGDAVEIEALSRVFREKTDNTQFCALGSVKGNIGHTDVAAGMAGLIKAVLCLYHQKIPATRHFEKPNPSVRLSESPFFINARLSDWKNMSSGRYAGVSAFGVGGTNAHFILGEYIQEAKTGNVENQKEELFLLSAKTETALLQSREKLIQYLSMLPGESESEALANVAHTLRTGRDDFQWRSIGIGKTIAEIKISLLKNRSNRCGDRKSNNIVFMFPGQGMQYHQMAGQLMNEIPRFSELVKEGFQLAESHLGCNLSSIIENSEDLRLHQTQYAQPALFIIEYALAKFLMESGTIPHAMIGHSIGEYVSACLAGVFSFQDALVLVCKRGLLMASAPLGAMLAIECSQDEFARFQKAVAGIELALQNAPDHCVASGSISAIECLEQYCIEMGKSYQRLKVSHAFHSQLMETIEQPFKNIFLDISLSAPVIPVISNLTGDWLLPEEAMNPDYWYRHLRHTVQFGKGLQVLCTDEHPIFVEIGPGHSLSTFLKATNQGKLSNLLLIQTLPNHNNPKNDYYQLLTALGALWQEGISLRWHNFDFDSKQHIPLPTYSFQRQRFWIAPDETNADMGTNSILYKPVWSWKPAYLKLIPLERDNLAQHSWLVFKDRTGLSDQLIVILRQQALKPIVVEAGTTYSEIDSHHFRINISVKEDYETLFKQLKTRLIDPIILHACSYDNEETGMLQDEIIYKQLMGGFDSVMYLTQSCLEHLGNQPPFKCVILTRGTQQVFGTESMMPVNAGLIGACRVIALEHPELKCQVMDINSEEARDEKLVYRIIYDCTNPDRNDLTVYRNGFHWYSEYVPVYAQPRINRLKNKGVYLITGGLGGIALTLCEEITKQVSDPTFILLSRTTLPPESEWEAISREPTNKLHKKIRALRTMRQNGARFHVQQVDITNFEALTAVIGNCRRAIGSIDGVIHCAGIAGGGLIQLKSKQQAHEVLMPKLLGTYHLAKVLQCFHLDFVVLMSSIAVLTGELGQMDYCAANASLDAFAVSQYFSSDFVVSLNWNTWREVGMAIETEKPEEVTFFDRGNDISPQQGGQLFLQALQMGFSTLVISNYAPDRYKNLVSRRKAGEKSIIKVVRNEMNITSDYRAPRNGTEKQLAWLWQESLGIDCIGIADDFFNLGGHSLKALKLIEKINAQFNCTLAITQLYRTPTIEKLSEIITLQTDHKSNDILVPLKTVNKNTVIAPCLFVCHPVSGLIYCFNSFCSQSLLPLSFYGLQDPSVDAGELLYDSFFSMAKAYLTAIKTIQPHGPYYLVGYSFGGSLLYEIAGMLRQEHEEIGLLALIESWAIYAKPQFDESQFKEIFAIHHPDLPVSLVNLAWKRMQLLLAHTPSKLNQEMLLFKAKELSGDYQSIDDSLNGWAAFNEGLIISQLLDANHETILSEINSHKIINEIENYLCKKGLK